MTLPTSRRPTLALFVATAAMVLGSAGVVAAQPMPPQEAATAAAGQTQDAGGDAHRGAAARLPASWGPGLDLAAPEGGLSFHLGVFADFDYTVFPDNEPFGGLVGHLDNNFDVRRFRIYGIVDVGDHLEARFDTDVASGDPSAGENYIGTRGFPWHARLGHIKEPVTLEVYSPVRYTTFAEHSLIAVFAPARNFGVRADYINHDNFTFQAGVFRESAGFDFIGKQYNYSTRAVWRPWGQSADRIVHLGGSLTHKDIDGVLRLTLRPEAASAPALIRRSIPADHADYAGAELWWREGPVQLQAEMMQAWVRADSFADPHLHAFYVQGSWFLTGERRPYRHGAFRRLVPNANVADGDGGIGAWEVAARYGRADLSEATVSGPGEIGSLTLGMNWYPNPWSRLVINWVHGTIVNLDVSAGSAWVFRGLIDF